MDSVTIRAAEADLSGILARVEAGEEIVLLRDDLPIAKIVRYLPTLSDADIKKPKREFGFMRGQFTIGPEFFEPLPEEELVLWEGGGD